MVTLLVAKVAAVVARLLTLTVIAMMHSIMWLQLRLQLVVLRLRLQLVVLRLRLRLWLVVLNVIRVLVLVMSSVEVGEMRWHCRGRAAVVASVV